jgi:hypothetical protein
MKKSRKFRLRSERKISASAVFSLDRGMGVGSGSSIAEKGKHAQPTIRGGQTISTRRL